MDHKLVLYTSISQEILIEYLTLSFTTFGETALSHSTRIKIVFHFFFSLLFFLPLRSKYEWGKIIRNICLNSVHLLMLRCKLFD